MYEIDYRNDEHHNWKKLKEKHDHAFIMPKQTLISLGSVDIWESQSETEARREWFVS